MHNDIVLDHSTHTYTNIHNDEKYMSVTTLIGKYKKPFDKDYWSKKIADRDGKDQDQVLKEWETITKTAQNRGTNIHSIMENYLKEQFIPQGYEELIKSFDKKCVGVIKSNSNILCEHTVYSHDYKLAGTADVIVENSDLFYILDFKTNKKFNFNSKYNDYFYAPLDYLQQCEFTTYTIQLSIYAYLHEQLTGKKCAGLKIFYLREFDNKTFWQDIAALYMKSTVLDLLQDKVKKDLL